MGDRTACLVLALLSFWAFAWLGPQDPGNTQVITRLGLSLSIVDGGRLDIDRIADQTIDKAEVDGHFYADKTPGHSILALPAVAGTHLAMSALGAETNWTDRAVFARYAFWATLLTNGVLSALAAAAVFLVSRQLGASQAGAVFAGGSLVLATPFLGWSTAFFAHTISGSLLVIALCLIVGLRRAQRPEWVAGAVGLTLSFTAVVDLTTAPTLVLLGLLALWIGWRERLLRPVVLGLAFGGVVGALPLAVYNQLAFGSPVRLGYSNVVGWAGMQQGFFGVQVPSPVVALELLFGLYRGLLPLAPVLVLVPMGLWVMRRDATGRAVALVIAAAILIHLAINAGYYYWNGGWSTGPRHLVPALPLAAVALAWIWPQTGWRRVVVLALLAIGMIVAVLCALGGMFAPEQYRVPFVEWVLPHALEGQALVRGLPVIVSWIALGWLLGRSAAPRTGSSAGLQGAAR